MTNLEKLAFEQLKEAVSKMNSEMYSIKNQIEFEKDPYKQKENIIYSLNNYQKAWNRYHEIIKAFEE
jgi:hypothetical protein